MPLRKYIFWGIMFCSVANAEPVVDRTEVNTYKAVLPADGKVVAGSCGTESIAVNRPGAWRCMAGNDIHDPCFTTTQSKSELVCGSDPVSGKPGFILKLTKPLPKTEDKTTVGSPWILQLANDTLCKPYTGTMPITDKGGISYYCYRPGEKPGASENCDTGLLQDSVKEGRVWTVTQVTFCRAPQGKTGLLAQKVTQVPIKTVWR